MRPEGIQGELPDYDSLPQVEGGARSGWNLFGPDDNVGLINLQTPERVASAARLVRRGVIFPLDIAIDFFKPPVFSRATPVRTLTTSDNGFDDWLDSFHLQGASQWDSLGHVAFKPGVFYNGATAVDIAGGRRNTIDHWARKGIAGRAILLDIGRAKAITGPAIDPLSSYNISIEDLETARKMANLEFRPGDVVLVETGHLAAYSKLDQATRRQLESSVGSKASPGLEHSEAMARYVWNTHAAAWASDNGAVEVWPPAEDLLAAFPRHGWPFGFLHHVLIGQFGLALGEYFWLADLATDCANDGVYEMFFTSAPLNVPGGLGSPPNALAIK
jgi:hypothetical protein